MRYLALVTDFDGTLAENDTLSATTESALQRLRVSGRRVILVTGRRLDDLLTVCPRPQLFEMIVAENGALLYIPASREVRLLADPPPDALVKDLKALGVEPLEIGEVLIATHEPHRRAVQDVVWNLGLEVQVIGNRGSVMLLPAGTNKGTGLQHALRELGLSRHEVVGVGDAENDHSFLVQCECPVAVSNAALSIKEITAFATSAPNGGGVVELIDELIASDLDRMGGKLPQHWITLGKGLDGAAVSLAPYGHNVLVAGPSGCGKSTFTAGIIERLIAKDYQVCILDPEGDYGTIRNVVAIGNQRRTPSIDEVLAILEDPAVNVSVNLLGTTLEDRPGFFAQLVPSLQAMRARTGRPHWIIVDEAHHLLPSTWGHTASVLPLRLHETILVTVHPKHVARDILRPVDVVVAVGPRPEETLTRFAQATDQELAWPVDLVHQPGHVVTWTLADNRPPFAIRTLPNRSERLRHHRKYAEGNLRWHSFYFRGPTGSHNLRAQNLVVFCQIAEGIDEQTWTYHLRRGDYSSWFRHAIRDEYLAAEAERVERRADIDSWQTREIICKLINARYSLPE
jgi:hydroxymethylpyrimidine pyrophosphatase-like HAD family hydrolase